MTTTTVLDELRSMLVRVLDQYGLDDVEITRETSFHDDLGLESIDLVTLGSLLVEHYGEHVNLAAYLAELDIDRVIALTAGDLADFVIARVA